MFFLFLRHGSHQERMITYFMKSLSTRLPVVVPTSPHPLLIRSVVPRETHSFSITSHSFSCSVMAASTIAANSLVFLFLCSVFSCVFAADGSLGRGKLDLVNKNEYFSDREPKSVFALLQAIGVYYLSIICIKTFILEADLGTAILSREHRKSSLDSNGRVNSAFLTRQQVKLLSISQLLKYIVALY